MTPDLPMREFFDDEACSVFNPVLVAFRAILQVALIQDIMAFEARLTWESGNNLSAPFRTLSLSDQNQIFCIFLKRSVMEGNLFRGEVPRKTSPLFFRPRPVKSSQMKGSEKVKYSHKTNRKLRGARRFGGEVISQYLNPRYLKVFRRWHQNFHSTTRT